MTSEISSSPKGKACCGVAAGVGAPANDSFVTAVVAAKDIPATLRTDKAVFGRLPLEALFACGMGSSFPKILEN